MEIQSVAVIGAGTMGSGIAQVCAQTGWKTWIFDVNRSVLEKSYSSIQDYWMKGVGLLVSIACPTTMMCLSSITERTCC